MATVAELRERNRKTALRALHAEGRKRGLDHDALRAMAGVESLSEVAYPQLMRLTDRLRGGPGIKSVEGRQRRGLATRKNQAVRGVVELVDGKSIEIIRGLAEALGWDDERLRIFTKRQLRGWTAIRTIGDANSVIRGMRAIYQRNKG